MKKTILAATLIIVLGLGLGADMGKELYYANISFVVWKLNNGPHEAAKVIGTPMPKVFKDSWIYDLVSIDVSDDNPNMKILEKDGFRFILTAESGDLLKILVFEEEKEIFRFVHKRPSTANYIFYGSDGMTYLIEVTYTKDNHPVGLLSPGIIK